MEFMNNDHKSFYNQMVARTHSEQDPYRKSLFYTLGLTDETRRNINNLYDFKENGINPDGMHGGWQTSTSWKVTKLAFNLYNGFGDPDAEEYTPYELFSNGLMEYMFNAVRLLYPNYTKAGECGEC
jgi:hypothetical protein